MTQYPGTFGAEYIDPMNEPRKTSGLAITALVLSLIICCPVTTVLGVVLGLIALMAIGPRKKGRGLAVAAIVVGLIFTLIWVWVGSKGYAGFVLMRDTPSQAIRAGMSGNLAEFKSTFGGAGVQVSDAEAQAFLDELRDRYGQISASKLDIRAFQNSRQARSQTMLLPYTLVFDKATVSAEAELDPAHQPPGSNNAIVFDYITIHDPTLGDLKFPPATGASNPTPSGSAPGNP